MSHGGVCHVAAANYRTGVDRRWTCRPLCGPATAATLAMRGKIRIGLALRDRQLQSFHVSHFVRVLWPIVVVKQRVTDFLIPSLALLSQAAVRERPEGGLFSFRPPPWVTRLLRSTDVDACWSRMSRSFEPDGQAWISLSLVSLREQRTARAPSREKSRSFLRSCRRPCRWRGVRVLLWWSVSMFDPPDFESAGGGKVASEGRPAAALACHRVT